MLIRMGYGVRREVSQIKECFKSHQLVLKRKGAVISSVATGDILFGFLKHCWPMDLNEVTHPSS